jgi:hypothetical protein
MVNRHSEESFISNKLKFTDLKVGRVELSQSNKPRELSEWEEKTNDLLKISEYFRDKYKKALEEIQGELLRSAYHSTATERKIMEIVDEALP